ncbi:ABC-2 transporter permease [Lacticaseibacillus rhamnosus]|nr:ABC-2 transporter permease [Lacticaseibacillus rhamnosus]
MTGFLIKDFIIVKKRILKLPVLISLFGAFLVAVFVNKDIAELFVFSSSALAIVALAIVALETLFQLDNQSHWKDFLVPYHLNPFKIVGSRYVFYAIACFATSFLAFVMGLIIEIIVPKTSPMQLFAITAIIFVVCSVFGIILLPAM